MKVIIGIFVIVMGIVAITTTPEYPMGAFWAGLFVRFFCKLSTMFSSGLCTDHVSGFVSTNGSILENAELQNDRQSQTETGEM